MLRGSLAQLINRWSYIQTSGTEEDPGWSVSIPICEGV